MNKNNKSGVTGVHWCKRLNRWLVTMRVEGKTKHFGVFTDLTEATKAIVQARKDNGYHKTHGVAA